MKKGICKLTGEKGTFAKAHIIPAALTRLDGTGPLTQGGRGRRPIRRWSSWYDPCLVTQAGEAILAEYDNWAIVELRRNKLIWSSWGPMLRLATSDFKKFDAAWGYRSISGIDFNRLRMFFLSLLWRAAETDRFEFSAIKLDACDLGRLRTMVLTGNAEPIEFYPITLIQCSTRGFDHNFSASAEVKTNPAIEEVPARTIPHFRFYFDGLIAHMHREAAGQLDDTIIGGRPKLLVTTVAFEGSYQFEKLMTAMTQADNFRSKQNGIPDNRVLDRRSFRSGR